MILNHTAIINKIRQDMRLYARLAQAHTGSQKAHYTAQYAAAQRALNTAQLARDNNLHAA